MIPPRLNQFSLLKEEMVLIKVSLKYIRAFQTLEARAEKQPLMLFKEFEAFKICNQGSFVKGKHNQQKN